MRRPGQRAARIVRQELLEPVERPGRITGGKLALRRLEIARLAGGQLRLGAWPLGPAAFPWPCPAERRAERPCHRQAGLDGIRRGHEPPDHVPAFPVRRRSRDGHACRFAPRAGSFPDRTGLPAPPAVSAKRHGRTRPPCDGGRRQARACRGSTPQEPRTEALSPIWATSPRSALHPSRAAERGQACRGAALEGGGPLQAGNRC